jgi:hypothetical protein
MGAWHQDGLANWLSVVVWLLTFDFDIPTTISTPMGHPQMEYKVYTRKIPRSNLFYNWSVVLVYVINQQNNKELIYSW